LIKMRMMLTLLVLLSESWGLVIREVLKIMNLKFCSTASKSKSKNLQTNNRTNSTSYARTQISLASPTVAQRL